jgi:tetratricopeptide (TPR) repeat protein
LSIAYKANANAAEANYQLGVEKFNKKDKPGAKPNFEQAAAGAAKAIELASTDTAPEAVTDQKVYYEIYAKNMALLVEHYGEADKIEEAVKMYDKAATLDPANKVIWEV